MELHRLGSNGSKALWCIFYASGIIITLVVYGLLQERIMTSVYVVPDGPDVAVNDRENHLFMVSTFLVLSNRIFNVLYAATVIMLRRERFGIQAPVWKYAVVSSANVLATCCQYEALKFVSFPVQMLAKSFKMIPVMLWGSAINGKWYNVNDWLVAVFVTFGIFIFMISGPSTAVIGLHGFQNSTFSLLAGLVLLGVFLAAEGLTSTAQEKLFRDDGTTKFNQMFFVNGVSLLICVVIMTPGGSLFYWLRFLLLRDDFARDVTALSVATASSQYFIYSQIQEYGALVFAITMNVRQMCSIAMSYIQYNHYITSWQVFSIVLVFSAIFYQFYMKAVAEEIAKEVEETKPLMKSQRWQETKAEPGRIDVQEGRV
jgi:adenosine 3'-phospho 5'-phosphosulfate transporter B2